MENHSATLLRRLNPYCAKALDGAASLCQTRASAHIHLEHWLLKLLEQGEGDLTVLARRYEWDLDSIWQDLLSWIDNQSRSVHARPQLSNDLQEILKQAWLVASLEGSEQIRSIHLLAAMIDNPKYLHCDGLWPLLTVGKPQLERLRPLLDAQSEEREEVQQAIHSSDISDNHLEDSQQDIQSDLEDATDSHTLAPALQSALDKFTQDVTAKAEEDKIDPIFGRDNEIRQMIDVLSRRRKNNPILVGEPGVGKTALVEGLALRIAQGNVPQNLQSVRLHTLDLGLLQAGAGVKGEFEQRLKNVITAVQQSPVPILLFIDEAHTIIGAGNQAGGADAANLLKPALARGELKTIAATTWSEYKQYFERDAALERRFQMVKVDEPDDETACLMLRGLKSRYAKFHQVHITDEAIRSAVTLSRRYLTGRQLPDKAVDLLDTAAARVRMSLDTLPEHITALKAKLGSLELEYQALLEDNQLISVDNTEKSAQIEQQIQETQKTLDEQQAFFEQEKQQVQNLLDARSKEVSADEMLSLYETLNQTQEENKTHSTGMIELDVAPRTVANVIADWTGVPLSNLMKDEQTQLLILEDKLSDRVIGQDSCLEAIAKRLRASKTGLTDENGPQGVFLLVGPSGVGKTETALALADILYGGEKSLITINLSEYQEAHTVSQLKGSPPGYVGYGQGGILTEAVRKRPYSVVLLDEVEKAHLDVMNLFYQVFDRGFMRDGEGREIDFRNTVILMTSNLGSDRISEAFDAMQNEQEADIQDDLAIENNEAIEAEMGQEETASISDDDESMTQREPSEGELQELLRPVLRDHFQSALLARFQTVIYRPLATDALRQIVEIKLGQIAKRLQRHYGIQTQFNDQLFDVLTSACLLPDTGARNIDSLLTQQILPVLSQQLLEHQAQGETPKFVRLTWSDDAGIELVFDEPQQA